MIDDLTNKLMAGALDDLKAKLKVTNDMSEEQKAVFEEEKQNLKQQFRPEACVDLKNKMLNLSVQAF